MDPNFEYHLNTQNSSNSENYPNFQNYSQEPFSLNLTQFSVSANVGNSQNVSRNLFVNVQQTRINPQKGAKNSWSVAEDLALMSAWCFVSKDKRCGKNQKGSSLWTRIAGMFEQSRLENPEGICERNLDSMKGRYKRLNENVNKWRGAYMEACRNKRSGMSMKDVEKEAHIIYEAGGSTKFTDLHVFEEVMRKHPKWELNLDRDSTRSRPEDDVSNEGSRGSSKRSKTNEDEDYSIPLNLETSISDGSAILRSEGRDMAKKQGKNVASQSSDEFTPEIRALRITRNNEYDLMTKIANDMMELERKKEERQIKKMNMMMLNTLLAKDHLSPEDEEMKRHLTTIVFGKSL